MTARLAVEGIGARAESGLGRLLYPKCCPKRRNHGEGKHWNTGGGIEGKASIQNNTNGNVCHGGCSTWEYNARCFQEG